MCGPSLGARPFFPRIPHNFFLIVVGRDLAILRFLRFSAAGRRAAAVLPRRVARSGRALGRNATGSDAATAMYRDHAARIAGRSCADCACASRSRTHRRMYSEALTAARTTNALRCAASIDAMTPPSPSYTDSSVFRNLRLTALCASLTHGKSDAASVGTGESRTISAIPTRHFLHGKSTRMSSNVRRTTSASIRPTAARYASACSSTHIGRPHRCGSTPFGPFGLSIFGRFFGSRFPFFVCAPFSSPVSA